jgi:DNA-binding NarL/FixJ family response regulator
MDPGRKRRARVVIADDNAIVLEQLGSLLESRFHVVGHAANGRELFAVVQKLLPSVVVTDITMPKMDGIEATRLITKHCPDVKVVVVSIHNDPVIVEAAFDAGVSGYVSKVTADIELIPAIEDVLAGRRYRSSKV